MQKTFLRVALPTPLRRLFDYLPPEDIDLTALIPGIRVKVPFQSRTLIGVLVQVVSESLVAYGKLKPALLLLDETPILPPDIDQLCHWAADYYHYSLGEVFAAALPSLLRKGNPYVPNKKIMEPATDFIPDIKPELNKEQQLAVDTIANAKHSFRPFLLDGVTGSGKTEVYLRAIEEILKENQQVLVLVPEISLTPQTIARFRARFSVPILALHSNLSEKQRFAAWDAAQNGSGAQIVIGTRSAIFTPFKALGLIIVDEEHDVSFKQQDRFRYHARDLAIMRASMNHIPVVLGSATPSLESLLNVERGRYDYLALTERAGLAKPPAYQLIDLRQETVEEGLSTALLQKMRQHLDEGNQVLLFLNRRGFAPVIYCTQCAWVAECKRCDTRMVYHRAPEILQCHHCDAKRPLPKKCGGCGQTSLQPVGLGTQRLEQTLEKYFPHIPIIRVDRDNTKRRGALQDLLEKIQQGNQAILLGTQMLAKGHHFPQVTLVGIIDADSGLFSADFRSAEQMGQLLLQVAGRAGRVEKLGTVLIQTRHPDHSLLQTLIQQGYHRFSKALLKERERVFLPPFSYFAIFRAEAYGAEEAERFLTNIKALAEGHQVTVLGPVPAFIAKRKGLHCQHLLLRANKRSLLQRVLKQMLQQMDKLSAYSSVKWVLDVDPMEV